MLAFSDNVKQGLTRMGGMKEPEKFIHTLKEFHSVQVIRPFYALKFELPYDHRNFPSLLTNYFFLQKRRCMQSWIVQRRFA